MGDEAEPTELAGVADAETESVHAWGLVNDDQETVESPRDSKTSGGHRLPDQPSHGWQYLAP
jgi:hypothetical protein